MDLDKAIKTRRSIRKFSKEKPDWRKIIEAIDATRYVPLAGKNFTMKFIVVSDKKKIEEIANFCQQDFIKEVFYVVVACSNYSRLTNLFGEKGEVYGRQQAGAAIQNFLLKLNDLGLSTCWVGHFLEDSLKKLLKIPQEVTIEAIFPIGFSSEKKQKDKEKLRIELERILYFDEYGKETMKK
ncbi:MAG: nitroreductase [Candidatus Pacearchaeota archaeon]|nr:MAG: nitroreductase [Candidatus Pacearchaeota archaeon]